MPFELVKWTIEILYIKESEIIKFENSKWHERIVWWNWLGLISFRDSFWGKDFWWLLCPTPRSRKDHHLNCIGSFEVCLLKKFIAKSKGNCSFVSLNSQTSQRKQCVFKYWKQIFSGELGPIKTEKQIISDGVFPFCSFQWFVSNKPCMQDTTKCQYSRYPVCLFVAVIMISWTWKLNRHPTNRYFKNFNFFNSNLK